MTDQEDICTIFRATRKQDHYLYVAGAMDVNELPGGLLELLGDLHKVMDLDLASRTELANADIARVREQIAECGYYLQMPPGDIAEAQVDLFAGTDKLQ